MPGSFYISQPDPNTAEVTPHTPETHTHTYINTMHTHLIHFRLHLQPNGVEERLEDVFSVPGKPGKLPETHTEKLSVAYIFTEKIRYLFFFLSKKETFTRISGRVVAIVESIE